MRILSFLILFAILIFAKQKISSPHGPEFKISCEKCHSPKGWQLDREIYSFDHNSTKLPLTGQHAELSCKLCHSTLIFSEAKTECNQCHNDIHQYTVGLDCSRCHSTASWLVNNITEIHQRSRFPLLGVHRTADCYDCHKSENLARFDVVGINCIDCHREEYMATTNPGHVEAGFSEDCSVCHSVTAFQWAGAGFNHNFFALVQGHAGSKCTDCHFTSRYSDASPECNSCHQTEYNNTTNPNHRTLSFSMDCNQCHTLAPGWKPALYQQHDTQFSIYSGKHKGEWDSCTDCHSNTSDYSQFTCLNCHEHNKARMDSEHRGESGYSYVSAACLGCHPRGNSD